MATAETEHSILPQKVKCHSHKRRKNSKFIKQGYHKSERDDIRRVTARTFLSGITLDSHLRKHHSGLYSDEVASGAGSVPISPVATRNSQCILAEGSNAQPLTTDVFVTGLLHDIPFDHSPYKPSAMNAFERNLDPLPFIGHSTSVIESPTERKQFALSRDAAGGVGVKHCGRSMHVPPGFLSNKRLAFATAKGSPFAVCSVIEYSEKFRLDHPRERMRVRANSLSLIQLELDGMELGTSTTEVSLAHLLAPQWVSYDQATETTPILSRKQSFHSREPVKRIPSLTLPASQQPKLSLPEQQSSAFVPTYSYPWLLHSSSEVVTQYHPQCLDNYEYFVGRHTTTLGFCSYKVSIIQYARQSDIKKGINEQFSVVFPHLKITLTKLRSIKRDMRRIALECDVSLVAVAYSYVYFEKVVLMGKINKDNRKLSAGACLLLAAKFISDIRRADIKLLLDKIGDVFRISTKELLLYEFPVLVVLQFSLFTPNHQVQSHWDKLKELDIS